MPNRCYFKSSNKNKILVIPLFFILTIVGGFHAPLAGADPSWGKTKYSEVRVIRSETLSQPGKNKHLIGLHIKMRKGWKTYWRRPGDSGIPPYLNWKGSENIKSVKMLWPAPKRLKDPYGTSIGYKDEVVFPIVFEAKDTSKPIDVKLTFGYGVCDDICIPEERKLSFRVPEGKNSSVQDHQLLSRFYKKIPKQIRLSEKGTSLPVIKSVDMVLKGKEPHLDLLVAYPEGSDERDVFVEVSDGFFIVEPKPLKEDGGIKKTYRIDLTKGDKVSELPGKKITVTLVSNKGHSEINWVVK